MTDGVLKAAPIAPWLLEAMKIQEQKAFAHLFGSTRKNSPRGGRHPRRGSSSNVATFALSTLALLALQRAEAEWSTYGLGVYTSDDMAVFGRVFAGAQQAFFATPVGAAARARGTKHILILSALMPEIARVDAQGMALHGQNFTWSPEGSKARRRAATSGKGPAGIIPANPSVPPYLPIKFLSWEEYPFASLLEGGAGAHVDKVPITENWRQGGLIGAAARMQRFQPSTPVSVFII